MSARRLIFHPGVEDDLADVVVYYGEIDPSLVGRFRFRFLEQVERVELYPESGAVFVRLVPASAPRDRRLGGPQTVRKSSKNGHF